MTKRTFNIETIGEAKILSPIQMSVHPGDGQADYVEDSDKIFLDIDHKPQGGGEEVDLLELAGPRKKIYFNPKRVHAAICTCGGICPGLNNVIRSVVRCFWYRYGVRRNLRYSLRVSGTSCRFPMADDRTQSRCRR